RPQQSGVTGGDLGASPGQGQGPGQQPAAARPPGAAAAQLVQLWSRLSRATHVEWWAHARPAPSCCHQLHWDCDETRLRQGPSAYGLVNPLISSVLFLTGPDPPPTPHPPTPIPTRPAPSTPSDTGQASAPSALVQAPPHACTLPPACPGPTLVLDQVPGQQGLAHRAWAVHPRLGRLLLFSGNLLHGVLPGPLALSSQGGGSWESREPPGGGGLQGSGVEGWQGLPRAKASTSKRPAGPHDCTGEGGDGVSHSETQSEPRSDPRSEQQGWGGAAGGSGQQQGPGGGAQAG
ncbi:hypothetical protein V8C86DRAFT_3029553, partial [Haematococcus lacustris]